MKTHSVIALIGNPNSGKTTVFNGLTGLQQRVGNWAGVTVEKKEGQYQYDDQQQVDVIDLPGSYSLVMTEAMPQDEKIACRYVLAHPDRLFINVIDASNLHRDLYLTFQLLELGASVVIALNCMDLAERKGLSIKADELSKCLNCPVVPMIANQKTGLTELKHAVANYQPNTQSIFLKHYQTAAEKLIPDGIQVKPTEQSRQSAEFQVGYKIKALEGDTLARKCFQGVWPEGGDVQVATLRRQRITDLLTAVIEHHKPQSPYVDRLKWLDTLVLNRFLGIPIFLMTMYLMFVFAINIGGIFQNSVDFVTQAIFMEGTRYVLLLLEAPQWLQRLCVDGIGLGINVTLKFIPVLGALFFSLTLLEQSGYMARAAFIIDKAMSYLGLPGQSFVPMIVGFGCNVPAVMGARTLQSQRERILTIMMSPFMSCSARLAIYVVFVAAFFPLVGHNIIFSLYLIGVLVAVLTGLVLKKAVLPGEQSFSCFELPSYRFPNIKNLMRQVNFKLKRFIIKAGTLIIPLCVLLNGIGINTIESMGKQLTPLFAPMGIKADNWPATVGLLTGMIAKETVVGTLNALYERNDNGDTLLIESEHEPEVVLDTISDLLHRSYSELPQQFAGLTQVLKNPVVSVMPETLLQEQSSIAMVTYFGGASEAYAYLLFTLLYFPCISVVASIAKELNIRWALFSMVWSTSLAYIIAVIFYQCSIASWSVLGLNNWLLGSFTVLAGLLYLARLIANTEFTSNSVPETSLRSLPTPICLLDT